MSQSFRRACEERSADARRCSPPLLPSIARQPTLSSEFHVQRTFGDENVAALIFGFLHPRDRVWATSACKQHLAHRPRDPTPWASDARMMYAGCELSCDELLFAAKLAEQAERYYVMVRLMWRLVDDNQARDLTLEERTLFTVAYKNVLLARCMSLRCIDNCIRSERSAEPVSSARLGLAEGYRERVAAEAGRLCDDMLLLLDALIARVRPDGVAQATEPHVFYLKCKADYLNHFAHLSHVPAPDLDAEVEAGYLAAVEAATQLAPSHPLRMATTLNWATKLADVRGRHEEAAELLKGMLTDVHAEMDHLDEESCKDTRIMLDHVTDTISHWLRGGA